MREKELATAVVPRLPSSFHSFGENLEKSRNETKVGQQNDPFRGAFEHLG